MSRGDGRAANGRSSIYKDDKGRWHGFVSMGTSDDGKPVRRHASGRTRSDVTARVAELEKERERTAYRPTPSHQLTVGAWLDEWLVIIQRTRKSKTFDNYTSLIRNHCTQLRRKPLHRLAVRDLDDLFFEISGRSPQSAISLHRVLRSSFNTAIKRGLMTSNPCAHATVPRAQETDLEPYDLDQCQRLLAAAHRVPNTARWSVALALGLRQGETLGLQWADVDFERAELRIRRQLQRLGWHHGCGQVEPDHQPARCSERSGGGWAFGDVKSHAGRRTVVLPSQLLAQFRAHRREQAAQRLAAGSVWCEHDLVFPRADGNPQHPSVDATAWRRLTETADVPTLRLHYARHTTATMLLAQGVDGRVVMGLLGWSQSSLLTRYQHVIDPLRRQAAALIDQAYWPAESPQ